MPFLKNNSNITNTKQQKQQKFIQKREEKKALTLSYNTYLFI